jgi:ParB-like chromosome segregation protein Spo0J
MKQPIETVEWVDPESLTANTYNPNRVPPREMALLKKSLMEDGWTQPIVAGHDDVIVDGFHRWSLGRYDADVRALSGGRVPVVRLASGNPADRRMATIRHNRARGSHYVKQMAVLVNELTTAGVSESEIGDRLGMEPTEVERLVQYGSSRERNSAEALSNGWEPGRR